MVSLGTVLSTGTIEDEGIVWTIRTLRSKEEYIFKGDVTQERGANVKVKDEFTS